MAINLWLGLYSAPGEWPWTQSRLQGVRSYPRLAARRGWQLLLPLPPHLPCGVLPRTSWRHRAHRPRSFRNQIGLMISATGRSGFGKTTAGVPGGAMKSWAAPRTVSAAAKAKAIASRGAPPTADMNARLAISIGSMAIRRERNRDRAKG